MSLEWRVAVIWQKLIEERKNAVIKREENKWHTGGWIGWNGYYEGINTVINLMRYWLFRKDIHPKTREDETE
jgi:hypothetical protein